MNQPQRPTPHGLPVLPDWPPLPGEPAQAQMPEYEWLSSGATPQDGTPSFSDDVLPPGPPRSAAPKEPGNVFRRLRSAPKRAQIGIAAAAVLVILLIVATSSFALHIASTATPGSAGSPQGGSSGLQAAGSTSTPTGQPTGTPDSTTAPTPTGSTQPLFLTFTCATGTLRGTGRVCVHTQPQAALSITVHYCDGTTARGLHGNVFADASGNYTWTWSVRTSCAGTATATVTARWNGQSSTSTDSFTITQ